MNELEMKGITKAFSGVTVLQGVNLKVVGGKAVALLGENGAGKSTLMKILTGEYTADEGSIFINQQPVTIRKIQDAKAHGIGMIHQELNLFANLSIAENFLIGNEEKFKSGPFVDYKALNSKVREILKTLNLNHSPRKLIGDLGVGEQQLVEIGKALQTEVRFLVMDEPTAALTESETKRLFRIIQDLKSQGVGIVYISHRMEELYEVADDVTVLRDGRFIATQSMKTANERELISLMVGRDVENRYPKKPSAPGNIILRVQDLQSKLIKHASLEVKAGEIVGLGGLMGAGRTEIARAITGVDRYQQGTVELDGKRVRFRRPGDAIRHGVAFVTEDRKEQGLVLKFSIRHNLALPTLYRRQKVGVINQKAEAAFANELVKRLRVKSNSVEQQVNGLSGGNQQKVVIGKWLANDPLLFVLDEPTRGVDVGAKQEIYELMNHMKSQGKGILMISSDLPELLGMSDRVYVAHEGKIQGQLTGENMTEENFMTLATGGSTQ